MLARMKSCYSPTNMDNKFKIPSQSSFKNNHNVLLNETGILLANGSFKSQQNHFNDQNNIKSLSTNNILSMQNPNQNQNIKNKNIILDIVKNNCNNTMPNNNLLNNKLLNEHNKIIEEVNSSRPSPNDRTLDINVVRYKDDDELN